VLVAPNRGEDALARQNLAAMSHEEGQELELRRREPDLVAVAANPAAQEIDLDVAGLEPRWAVLLGLAKVSPDAGGELIEGERLGHVIRRACVESLDALGHLSPGGQQNYRQGRKRAPDAGENLKPVAPRQHDVQQHEVEPAADGLSLALESVRGARNLVALSGEAAPEEVGDPRLVLDDQNPHRVGGMVGRRLSSTPTLRGFSSCETRTTFTFTATSSPAPHAPSLRVLIVNAGSSSVKLSVLGDGEAALASFELTVERGEVDRAALRSALADLPAVDAIGHRIVHGGERFVEAVRIDPEVEAALHELADLAPLHQPKSLAALAIVGAALPDKPAVACFDTAFHSTLPDPAATYALPTDWRERFGLRRFGFHGLSHAYASRRAPELLGRPVPRLVTCHLGAGASLAAVRDGRSVDTTMGFTPLEGLVMATRSGSVDPGLLLWLLEREAIGEREMAAALEHSSGLAGLAGTPDMREVLARSEAGDGRASVALEVYLHRLRAGIAAMAAALGGLDGLVFTGGVGERSSAVRSRACEGLGFLGVELDASRNHDADGDARIGADGTAVATLVIAAREDIEIAREVRSVLSEPQV
jgi:acetate kinase